VPSRHRTPTMWMRKRDRLVTVSPMSI